MLSVSPDALFRSTHCVLSDGGSESVCLCVNGAQWPCLDWDATFLLFSLAAGAFGELMTPRGFSQNIWHFWTEGNIHQYMSKSLQF